MRSALGQHSNLRTPFDEGSRRPNLWEAVRLSWIKYPARRQRRHLSRGARQLLPEQGGAAGPHPAADFAARQSGLSARSGDHRDPAGEGIASVARIARSEIWGPMWD